MKQIESKNVKWHILARKPFVHDYNSSTRLIGRYSREQKHIYGIINGNLLLSLYDDGWFYSAKVHTRWGTFDFVKEIGTPVSGDVLHHVWVHGWAGAVAQRMKI